VTLLEQQELMAPPPRRRLIVPKGHSAVWGIDPSSVRVALAALSRASDGYVDRMVKTQSFSTAEGAERLSGIYRDTFRFVQGIAVCCTWPGLVVVEQPSGQTPNPQLVYAVGVIQAAVWDALYDVMGIAPRMETVPSATWKKIACGRGNLYKPKGRGTKQTDYAVFRWAVENGWNPSSWDEADAAGIAEAAAREVLLEER
jgi:hypothetical protein